MIKRLLTLGASVEDLKDTYLKQIRSILEYGVPVWHPGLSNEQSEQVERVQKTCIRIILSDTQMSYKEGLAILELERLDKRREKLCLKFAKSALNHKHHSKWFVPFSKNNQYNTRQSLLLKPTFVKTEIYEKSPIPYLTKLLNQNSS